MDLGGAAVAIGEPGRVPQEVLDGHLALGEHPVARTDPQLAEGGEVLRNGVGDEEPAFLVEHHRRHRDHRLSHGRDAEDGIGRHQRAGRLVTEADRFQVGDAALAGDHDDGASQPPALDVRLQRPTDALQAHGGQADLLGLRRREASGVGG